ncbi:MAG: hypothetical protein HCTETUND2_071 [Candidatus Hodgkinia cicadicola]|nr:MAG: hypothetical protein HCTETUND2_071 [Candidatus Hodgkinia cicadicola]
MTAAPKAKKKQAKTSVSVWFSPPLPGGLEYKAESLGLSFSWRLLLVNRWAFCEGRRRKLRL